MFNRTFARKLVRYVGLRTGLKKAASRHLTVREDDTFVVSYPRSGNTWIRCLLAVLSTGGPVNFGAINDYVPDIYECSDREMLRRKRPRVIKSHEALTANYPRSIYVVRDPRDVAISFYHWRLRNGTLGHPAMPLEEYLDKGFGERELNFMGWGQHVDSWLDAGLGAERLQVVRFEDLKRDTMGTLLKVATFMGLPSDEGSLRQAMELCTLDAMRQSEEEASAIAVPEPILRLLGRRKIHAARKGKAGAWATVFSPELNAAYWDRFGPTMRKLGYTKEPVAGKLRLAA